MSTRPALVQRHTAEGLKVEAMHIPNPACTSWSHGCLTAGARPMPATFRMQCRRGADGEDVSATTLD